MAFFKEKRVKRVTFKSRSYVCLLSSSFIILLKVLLKSKFSPTFCKCGVYTPYHLTAGGGEKMILSFVKTLQKITTCKIDLIVQRGNVCQNISCLKQLAKMLSVDNLKWDRVKFRTFSARKLKQERMLNRHYLIWIHMSNSLLPTSEAFGIFNVFHSQFPFDGLETPQNLIGLERLEKYQSVYLNSHYTLSWYEKFLERESQYYMAKRSNTFCFPGLTHFTPPFNFETKEKVKSTLQARANRNIILVGRFFEGMQSKRQLEAIEAFNRITKIRKDLKLYLCGFMATGQENYVEKVKGMARSNRNVILHIGASQEELEKAHLKSLVVWSITGLESSSDHPADAEHFGIGLLEAMVRGIIPIVVNKGGPVEIVEGLSFKSTISSVDELVATTINLLDNDDETLRSMQQEVMHLAYSHLKEGGFESSFASMFSIMGMKLSPGKEVLWQKFVLLMKKTELEHCKSKLILPMKSKKVALYVENRHDSSLRANVYRLMSTLGPSWGLNVIHSPLNEHYLKSLLKNVENVRFQNVEDILVMLKSGQDEKSVIKLEDTLDPRKSNGIYNLMWKSSTFWEDLGDVEKVFSFQSDSWFLGSMNINFESYEVYDYLGSPWCLEENSGFLKLEDRPKNAWNMLHETRQLDSTFRIGNGGISFRNVGTMNAIIEKYSKNTSVQENEDVFFVHYLHKEGYRVAGKNPASRFGLECFCKDVPVHNEIIELWFWLLEMRKKEKKYFLTRRLSNYVLFMHKPELVYSQLVYRYLRSSSSPVLVDETLHEMMMDVFVEHILS